MKTNIYHLFCLIIGITVGIAVYGSYQAHIKSYHMTTENPYREPDRIVEYVYIESEPEVITEVITEVEYVYIPQEEPFYLNLTEQEISELEQIAYAEARGEGIKGMALVMNVVLNRSAEWEKSIHDVIFAQGQFYTAGMTPNVSEDCHEAMQLVIEGYDESQGALFFNKYGYRNGKEPLFQYKNHYFSR